MPRWKHWIVYVIHGNVTLKKHITRLYGQSMFRLTHKLQRMPSVVLAKGLNFAVPPKITPTWTSWTVQCSPSILCELQCLPVCNTWFTHSSIKRCTYLRSNPGKFSSSWINVLYMSHTRCYKEKNVSNVMTSMCSKTIFCCLKCWMNLGILTHCLVFTSQGVLIIHTTTLHNYMLLLFAFQVCNLNWNRHL